MLTSSKLVGFLLISSVASSTAAVQLTFSGTVSDSQGSLGYTVNDAVSFTMTTLNGPLFQQLFGEDFMTYKYQGGVGVPIWASLEGTGMSGSYQAGSNPFDFLDLENPFRLYFAADYTSSMNITVGGQEISYIYGDLNLSSLSTIILASTNPDVTFTPVAGTYSGDDLAPTSYFYIQGLTGTNSARIAINSLTISIIPIPEPGALAFASVCCAGFLFRRRR
jgi:hypothetical protein